MSAQNGDDTGNPATSPQRRRSFLASRQDEIPEANTPPIIMKELDTFPGIEKEEDIPVLTEIISIEEEEHEAPISKKEPPPPDLPVVFEGNASIEELVAQMTQAIEQQMAYELPTLVEATLLSASEDLRSGIASTMEAALRDFLARYKQQLQQPPDQQDHRDHPEAG
jgi:hypothetical protein